MIPSIRQKTRYEATQEFTERLGIVFDALKKRYSIPSDRKLCLHIKMSRSMIIRARQGLGGVNVANFVVMIDKFPVNLEFLFRGKGDPLL